MNRVMVGAVNEFFERFLTSTLSYLGLKTTPRGGFVLEHFWIEKEGWPENAYLLHRFSKNATRFLEKAKLPRKRCPNFLSLVEKPLKNVPWYTPAFLPLPENEAN